MNDSQKLLKAMLGDQGYEVLEKAIFKQRTQAVVDPLEYYLPLIVVPRTIISWLVQTIKPMKTGEIKDVKFPGRDDIAIHFEKQDIDQYRAEFVSGGRVIHSFEKQSLPAASAHLMTVGELYEEFGEATAEDEGGESVKPAIEPKEDAVGCVHGRRPGQTCPHCLGIGGSTPKVESDSFQAVHTMIDMAKPAIDPEQVKWEMSHANVRELTAVIGKLVDSLVAKQMFSSRLETELDKVSEKEVKDQQGQLKESKTPEEKAKEDAKAQKKDQGMSIDEMRRQAAKPSAEQEGPTPKVVQSGEQAQEGKIQKDSMKESDGWKISGSTATHPEHGSIHRNIGGDYEAHHPKLPRNPDHPNRGWANAGIHRSVDDAKAHLRSLSEKHSAVKKQSLEEASQQAARNISSPRMSGAQKDQDQQKPILDRMSSDKVAKQDIAPAPAPAAQEPPPQQSHPSESVSLADMPMRKKMEMLMKPYRSEAQRRWAHTARGKEALGGEAKVKEWDRESKGKDLPERVEKDMKHIEGVNKPFAPGDAAAGISSQGYTVRGAMRTISPEGNKGQEFRQPQGGPNYDRQLAQDKARRTLRDLKAMPKPNLPKAEMAKDEKSTSTWEKAHDKSWNRGQKWVYNKARDFGHDHEGASKAVQRYTDKFLKPKLDKAEMPKGAGQPKQPKMPEPPKPPVPAGNTPQAAAAKQAQSSGQGGYKPPQTPGAQQPKNPTMKPKTPTMKSERHFMATEEQLYKGTCEHCGIPEFKKNKDGNPEFNPCACFKVLKKDEDGRPYNFVQAFKKGDGSFGLAFAPDADPEQVRLFLLTLKARLLIKKNHGI